jgi:hypothetical protein
MTKARDLADRTAADLTAVTAGTGISITDGTGPIPTVTNTVATGFDAKGDLIVGTGADTFAKLTVASTAGYLLSVDSGETTGLKWAAPAAGLTFVGVSAFKSGTQSLTSGAFTAITFDSEDYDSDSFHSTVTNTSRLTIPSGKDGKYLVTGVAKYESGINQRAGQLHKNGSNVYDIFTIVPGGTAEIPFTYAISLVATDYLELYLYQNTGSPLNVKANTSFQISYLGA